MVETEINLVLHAVGGVDDRLDSRVHDFTGVHVYFDFVADFGLLRGMAREYHDGVVDAAALREADCPWGAKPVTRPLTVFLFFYLIFFSWPMLALQDSHTTKPLTNADVLDMLKAGISQDIVIAKIKKSACEFDTSPAALKALKAANTPDAIILSMVEASSAPPNSDGTTTSGHLVDKSRRQWEIVEEFGVAIPARVSCNHSDPVPVFSAPRDQSNSAEVFKVKCGDSATIIEPIKEASWVKIRTEDGRVGYISWAILSVQAPAEPETQNVAAETEKQIANKKRDEMQKAADDLEDCRTEAQNEYETKMNAVNTLTITPTMRIYASTRLKQNYDAEVRTCRSQYEARMRAIDAESSGRR